MSILIENISKRYGDHTVVDGVSLDVADGELVVLLGSSGSGKSTILRMVAGLIMPDDGRILLNNSDITRLPPPTARPRVRFPELFDLPQHDHCRECRVRDEDQKSASKGAAGPQRTPT